MSEKLPMTADGLAKLKSELESLKNSERPNIIKAIAEAREHGDLSENAEYHAAREKQSFIEGRISELENKISRAEVIDISSLDNSKIAFGKIPYPNLQPVIAYVLDQPSKIINLFLMLGNSRRLICFRPSYNILL